ncbi:MerR family transcriptional regulator [Streptosporangium sp. NBC_01755]|uniref:MerR family transcriptional regulator n=1 Tax=unclassified Streptosporangium TaxID=2632669 RepID=UPI002DD93511|nr:MULTISPECIES: MerR family transcriptional regulator [unclassified Streptosporangium]WSA25963.1 MerR family transcriptional regulator [Streptosporangium sp. NBC_01810]WSD02648.1 MerR family transcriptional regulator [Streptosporangium sp. NBC_01755]
MNEGYLPIGRFARLCRLSVKQLRHYDELGLLTPDHVDPDTGYRYYRPDQARAAMLISLLRSIDVPLPSIGRVLSGDTGALGDVRDRMEADLARRERNFTALERILSEGLHRPEVTVVREPARRVAVVRDIATLDQIGAVTSACVARLLAAVGDPRGLMIGLFPLDLAPELAVAVAVETSEDVPGTSPDVLPGGLYASVTHVGSYHQIPLTAHALLAWVGERGHTPEGPLREVYVSNPITTPQDRLVTHLMIKLEDSE